MNIRTNGTTDGHLASTRQYRHPQAVGQRGLHQLIQRDTAVDINNRRLLINGVNLVELLHVDDKTARVLGGVAVGAAHTAGNYTAAQVVRLVGVLVCDSLDGVNDFIQVRRRQHLGLSGGSTTPTG